MQTFSCTGHVESEGCVREGKSVTITPPVISSQITTAHTFSFLYGKVEIRAKLPSENWFFPQLLLESTQNFYGQHNLKSGQMRIAFTKGTTGVLQGGVLLGSSEPTRTLKMCRYANEIDLSKTSTYFVEVAPPINNSLPVY